MEISAPESDPNESPNLPGSTLHSTCENVPCTNLESPQNCEKKRDSTMPIPSPLQIVTKSRSSRVVGWEQNQLVLPVILDAATACGWHSFESMDEEQ